MVLGAAAAIIGTISSKWRDWDAAAFGGAFGGFWTVNRKLHSVYFG